MQVRFLKRTLCQRCGLSRQAWLLLAVHQGSHGDHRVIEGWRDSPMQIFDGHPCRFRRLSRFAMFPFLGLEVPTKPPAACTKGHRAWSCCGQVTKFQVCPSRGHPASYIFHLHGGADTECESLLCWPCQAPPSRAFCRKIRHSFPQIEEASGVLYIYVYVRQAGTRGAKQGAPSLFTHTKKKRQVPIACCRSAQTANMQNR
mmetsp:Transcript_35277/g.91662  ORF Transcript_35277/g.91662 Transcript_35277/m.91662 type:complete len:201 (-) Transcript_35277:40-642(-)